MEYIGKWQRRFGNILFGEHLVMHKIFLLLLLFYDKFLITLEEEDGEDELHEVHVDDVK